MLNIFVNNRNIIAITILFMYWCEINQVKAKVTAGKSVEKLEFWRGDNSPNYHDGRRIQKKKPTLKSKGTTKVPQSFQPEIETNDPKDKVSHVQHDWGQFAQGNMSCPCDYYWEIKDLLGRQGNNNNFKSFIQRARLPKISNSTNKYSAVNRVELTQSESQHKLGKGQSHFKKLSAGDYSGKGYKKNIAKINKKKKKKNQQHDLLWTRMRNETDTNQFKLLHGESSHLRNSRAYSKENLNSIQMVLKEKRNKNHVWNRTIKKNKRFERNNIRHGKKKTISKQKDKMFNKSYLRHTQSSASPRLKDETTSPKFMTNSEEQATVVLNPYGIVPQMMQILRSFKNANVTSEILGRTAEYNDIALFKITKQDDDAAKFRAAGESKYIDEAPEKKIIFIVHGLTVMGLLYLTCLTEGDKTKLLIEYYLSHLDKFDIFLIPIANPDGYVASRTGGYWNKNRSPQKDCSGVMLDRNFDVSWNTTVRLSSCSQSYPGPGPFSEPETRAVRDVFHYHGHKIIAYIHVHAGTYDVAAFKGDAVLYPKGYTEIQSDDDKYIDIRGEIDESMKNASFQVVSVAMDTLHNWYGKVSGSSVDYATTVYGIPFAMEFVMQLYANSMFASADEDLVEYSALTQIWKRVIDVVFNYIGRTVSTNVNEVRKKFK